MINWRNNMSYLLLILTIAFYAKIAISDNYVPILEENALEKSKQKIIEEEQWVIHQVKRVLIYTHSNCTSCEHLKSELKKHNIAFQHIDLTWNRKQNAILSRKSGKEDVSYVFIGNEYIGNHETLRSLLNQGKLRKILEGKSE